MTAKERRHAVERQKFAEERRAFEEQRKRAEEIERGFNDRRRNPSKFLEQTFGSDWRDKIAQIALTGTPTPDLIASELDERMGTVKQETMSEVEKLRQELAEEKKRFAAAEQRRLAEEAIAHARQADKYPLLNLFEEWNGVPAAIDRHYAETTRKDEDGNEIAGERWSAEQAAKFIEDGLASIEKKFYERFQKQSAAKPPPQQPVKLFERTETPQRRTLTTEMTATSASELPPAKDDKERMARAFAAMEASMAARKGAA